MRNLPSCRICRGTLNLIAHIPGPTRAGREYYQCRDCADLTWRDVPDLPSYRLQRNITAVTVTPPPDGTP